MTLARKQKVLITLIIVAFAFMVWQLYGIFGNDSAPASIASQPTNIAAITPTPKPIAPVTNALNAAENFAPKPLQLNAPITRSQAQYLQLLNRYEIVKMKRMVIDEEAAIAQSQAKIAELNQQTQRISGRSLAVVTNNGGNSQYQLMYVDYQNGHWSATINSNGRFEEINRGMTLPDGSQITWIDQHGVILRQNNTSYLLSFYGLRAVPDKSFLSAQAEPVATSLHYLPAMKVANTATSAAVKPTLAPNPVANATVKPITASPTPAAVPPINKTTTTPLTNYVTQSASAPVVTKPNTTPVNTNVINNAHNTAPLVLASKSTPILAPAPPVNQTHTLTTQSMAPINLPTKPEAINALNSNIKTVPNSIITNKTAPVANLAANPTVTNNNKTTPNQINVATNIHNTNSGSLAISTIAANSTDKLHTDTPASANTTHTPSLILNPVPPNAKSKSPAPSLTSSQKEKVVQLETYMSTKQTNLDTDTIQHLLSLPANHFTLQLLSSDKLNDLTDFIKTNKLTKDVYIYHTDKDRYILIYGIYETEHAALAAIKQLPLAARELKPWVRSIASVQEALNPKPKIAIEAN